MTKGMQPDVDTQSASNSGPRRFRRCRLSRHRRRPDRPNALGVVLMGQARAVAPDIERVRLRLAPRSSSMSANYGLKASRVRRLNSSRLTPSRSSRRWRRCLKLAVTGDPTTCGAFLGGCTGGFGCLPISTEASRSTARVQTAASSSGRQTCPSCAPMERSASEACFRFQVTSGFSCSAFPEMLSRSRRNSRRR